MAAEGKQCLFCRRSETNDLDFGEWKTAGDITVHYYCLVCVILAERFLVKNLLTKSFLSAVGLRFASTR